MAAINLCYILRNHLKLIRPRLQFNKFSSSSIKVINKSPMSPDSPIPKLYHDAIRDLNSLQSNYKTLGLAPQTDPLEKLAKFRKLNELFGLNQQKLNKLNVIHIAGTKGKGSTCVFIESILRRNGLKTGFYNSPHLLRVNERIQINGQPLDYEAFAKYFHQVYDPLMELCRSSQVDSPSYFYFLTMMAFHVFLEEKVDCAIVEVGIGGEFDPTNVIDKPIACGITTLDYDHTSILGNTIECIARSKAGICKPGAPLFTVDQPSYKATLDVISSEAKKRGAPLYICKPLTKLGSNQLGIKGRAQLSNAALASQISLYYLSQRNPKTTFNQKSELECDFSSLPDSFQTGLIDCNWNGRCQILELNEKVVFFLDGAHTKESMKNCIDWFNDNSSKNCTNLRKILLVNIIGDRSRQEIFDPITQHGSFDVVIFSSNIVDTDHMSPDTCTDEKIDKIIRNLKLNIEAWSTLNQSLDIDSKCVSMITVRESLKFIKQLVSEEAGAKFEILVTGSLHFVGAVMNGIDLYMNKI